MMWMMLVLEKAKPESSQGWKKIEGVDANRLAAAPATMIRPQMFVQAANAFP
jgi:hypothetical protein